MQLESKPFDQIMDLNSLLNNFTNLRAFCIKLSMLRALNKMLLLRGSINTSWMWPSPYCFMPISLTISSLFLSYIPFFFS